MSILMFACCSSMRWFDDVSGIMRVCIIQRSMDSWPLLKVQKPALVKDKEWTKAETETFPGLTTHDSYQMWQEIQNNELLPSKEDLSWCIRFDY